MSVSLFFPERLGLWKSMNITTLLIISLVSLVGSSLQASIGFGNGIFVMIFFPHLLSSQNEAAALSSLTGMLAALILAIRLRRHVNWRTVAALLPMHMVVSFFFIRLAAVQHDSLLRALLGGTLILFAIYYSCFQKRLRLKGNLRNALLAGGIGGVLAGLFSTGGPPIALYIDATAQDKKEYLSTIQGCFLISNGYQSIMRAANGMITESVLQSLPLCIVAMFLGTIIGQRLFTRMNENVLRKALYIMIGFGGLMMLVS